MNSSKNLMDGLLGLSDYESPKLEVVEFDVERGFEASSETGIFEGPSYGEEDVVW